MNVMNGVVLGVDVGGTFTDCVVLDLNTGIFNVAKVPTTPADQSKGFLGGIKALDLDLAHCHSVVHGTTAATNAVLERKGARCGLITTRGFRDILEMARRTRPQLYGLTGTFESIIPRDLRYEVTERIDARGRVVTPLAEEEVVAATRELIKAGVEAIVIHFLHAYVNPIHERQAADIVHTQWPGGCLTAGSEILPEIREFERGSAAAMNGYVQPLIRRYLSRLSTHLAEQGYCNALLVMQGNGGMLDAELAGRHAIHTVMSGPAAGAIAAGKIGSLADLSNLITCDMGGTSFDVSVIVDGIPMVTRERDIDYGLPMRLPMVDIHTIGAGGGSVARVTRGGLLKVGPDSAGADPGAIAYGRGGTEPTVTDANVLLGRINSQSITGSHEADSLGAVRDAITSKIGDPLGLDVTAAAEGIIAVANHAMANAIRFVLAEKGVDQRDFAIFAFGGAGPLHARDLARELGIPRVLVPRFPGITSALGCVLADIRHDYGVTIGKALDEVEGEEIDQVYQRQRAEGERLIEVERVIVDTLEVIHEADLLYAGQTHVMRLRVDSPGFDPPDVARSFVDLYRERFDVDLEEMRPVLMAVRTTVIGRRGGVDAMLPEAPSEGAGAVEPAVRKVRLDGSWIDTPVYRREALVVGQILRGPAVIEQMDTTTLIGSRDEAIVDRWGNLVIAIDRLRNTGKRDAA